MLEGIGVSSHIFKFDPSPVGMPWQRSFAIVSPWTPLDTVELDTRPSHFQTCVAAIPSQLMGRDSAQFFLAQVDPC